MKEPNPPTPHWRSDPYPPTHGGTTGGLAVREDQCWVAIPGLQKHWTLETGVLSTLSPIKPCTGGAKEGPRWVDGG